jgi:hypothetical protein
VLSVHDQLSDLKYTMEVESKNGERMACTNLLYNAFVVYDEHASQADTLVLDQYPVVPTQAMSRITEQRDVNPSEATILPRNVLPMP